MLDKRHQAQVFEHYLCTLSDVSEGECFLQSCFQLYELAIT